ncbi:stage II sporulation protein P [bacterium AH-315-G05]|nr:stage II sporulation protein P [bacterium AH-315-G05]
MIKKKRKNHQNLMILLLALVLLVGSVITFSRGNIFDNNARENKINLRNLGFELFEDDVFLQVKLGNTVASVNRVVKNLYSFFAKSIFSIDISEPITFIQTQFTASVIYSNSEVYVTSVKKENNLTANDVEEQHTNLNSSNVVQTNTALFKEESSSGYDKDDLGEESEGIYLVRDKVIIDSLKNIDDMNFRNIDMPAKISWSSELPQILIYHTHGTEAYKPASEGNFHTLKKEYSVFVVGEILTRELEKRGFNVIHDIMYHNYPSFGGSYKRSLERAEKILKANPSIKVVLDVHRDGFNHIHLNPNINSIIKNNQVEINGEISTKFQVVVGSETPNRNEVENFAGLIKAVSETMFPGFAKPILTKPYGRFNQFLSDHYLLLEVGSNANTIEEARRAAHHLADVIAASLKTISSNY